MSEVVSNLNGPVAKAQASAPLKIKKDDPYAIKYKDHAELEGDLALASIKNMGYRVLQAQIASKNTSPEFKAACKLQIKSIEAARAATQKIN